MREQLQNIKQGLKSIAFRVLVAVIRTGMPLSVFILTTYSQLMTKLKQLSNHPTSTKIRHKLYAYVTIKLSKKLTQLIKHTLIKALSMWHYIRASLTHIRQHTIYIKAIHSLETASRGIYYTIRKIGSTAINNWLVKKAYSTAKQITQLIYNPLKRTPIWIYGQTLVLAMAERINQKQAHLNLTSAAQAFPSSGEWGSWRTLSALGFGARREHRVYSFLMFVTLLAAIVIGCVDQMGASSFGVNSAEELKGPNAVGNISILKNTTTSPVGTLGGKFAVDRNGAATYEIPIRVPPGTNGMQPELSLTYNSQLGISPIGFGWSLSSISSIQRCPRTKIQDAALGGINFDANNDRFCLDGLRLVRVDPESGEPLELSATVSYFVRGAFYATESQTYTKIQAHPETQGGLCGNGPCYFIAYNKDGTKLEFGNYDAGFYATERESVTLAWSLYRTTDLNGNYVQMKYNDSVTERESGEYYITDILYTGNANVAPQRKVHFKYDQYTDRKSDSFKWVSGSQVKISRRLSEIQTWVQEADIVNGQHEWAMVSKYKLNFDRDPYDAYDILKSVKRCVNNLNSDGSVIEECLPPTEFSYGATGNPGTHSFVDGGDHNFGSTDGDGELLRYLPMDVNNDGKEDMIRLSAAYGLSIRTCISNGSVFSCAAPQYGMDQNKNNLDFWAMDYNGDGKTDIVQGWRHASSSALCTIYYKSKGDGTFADGIGIDPHICANDGYSVTQYDEFIPMDIDGDGYTDLAVIEDVYTNNSSNDKIRYYRSNGSHLEYINSTNSGIIPHQGSHAYYSGDVNGDGCSDIIVIDTRNTNEIKIVPIFSKCSTTEGFTVGDEFSSDIYAWGGNFQDSKASITDINGDGLSDVLFTTIYNGDNQGNLYVVPFMSNGKTFTYTEENRLIYPKNGITSYEYIPMDVNGDGMQELIRGAIYGEDKTHFQAIVSKGVSFHNDKTTEEKMNHGFGHDDIMPVDVNGDGMPDIVQFYGGNKYILYFSKLERPFVSKIVDGLGGTYKIEYKPLTDSTVYKIHTYCPDPATSSADCAFKNRDVKSSLPVVSNYTEKDERDEANGGYNHSYKYFYTAAKSNVDRGWLGFRQIEARNAANKISHVDVYNQYFPYIGMPTAAITMFRTYDTFNDHSDDKQHQSVEYIYDDLRKDKPSKKINEVVLTQSNTVVYPIDGKEASYKTVKKYAYGSYGNMIVEEDLRDSWSSTDSLSLNSVDPIYTCHKYKNDPGNSQLGYINQLGYLIETKVSTDRNSCESSTWTKNIDIAHSKVDYDSYKNVTMVQKYDDSNDSATDGRWIDSYTEYYSNGNLKYTYDKLGLERHGESGEGNTKNAKFEIIYDNFYNTFPVKIIAPKPAQDDLAASALEYEMQYEPYYGNQIASKDPNGIKSKNVHDRLGRLVEAYANDLDGELTLITKLSLEKESRPVGTTNAYMDHFSMVKSLVKWGSTEEQWSKSYVNAIGNNYKSTRNGIDSSIIIEAKEFFDYLGRITSMTAPYFVKDGIPQSPVTISSGTYNSYNYPTKLVNSDGTTTCYEYKFPHSDRLDEDNRKYTKVITTVKYDNAGCSTMIGQKTTRYLNVLGNSEKTILPNGGVTTYDYDAAQRLVSMSDPEGIETSYTYDSLGRQTIISADMGKMSAKYDQYGRLSETTDGANNIVTFVYDDLRRLTSKTSTHSGTPEVTQYKYDEPTLNNGLGKLTSIEIPHPSEDRPLGKVTYMFGYDNNGLGSELKVRREDRKDEDEEYIFHAENDPQGRAVRKTLPDNTITDYVYTIDGNLSSIMHTGIDDQLIGVTYSDFTELGEPKVADYSNGVKTTFKYFPNGNNSSSPYGTLDDITIVGKDSSGHAADLLILDYGWKDDVVSSLTETAIENDLPKAPHTQNFGYDHDMNFLSSASDTSGAAQIFTYDKAGTFNKKGTTTFHYNYNGDKKANHRIKEMVSELEGTLAFGYLGNGNIQYKHTSSSDAMNFVYDSLNNLRQVTKTSTNFSPSTLGTYWYDSSGRRITKADNGNGYTQYIAPSYEVSYPNGSTPQYTKYINGLYGRVASITEDSTGNTR